LKQILLDTDAGVDDVLALLLLLRSPDLASCAGITVVAGNTHLENCVANVRRALGVAELYADGRTANVAGIPLAIGAAKPLTRPLLRADEVHGPDGLGGTSMLTLPSGAALYPECEVEADSRPAYEFILQTAAAAPGEITLVAIGPLTNVAMAVQADPARFHALREIVVMGGAFHHDGNVSSRAEFNIRVDPEAAQLVLDSGVPVTMVPLDCTEKTRITRRDLDGDGPVHQFARHATGTIMQFYQDSEGFDGFYLHDPLAIGIALDRTLAFGLQTRVVVETKGEFTLGETVSCLRRSRCPLPEGPDTMVCLQPDARRFETLFLERVLPHGA
jgi:purine nucleosidase/pyrimidine-specific ribonucleoside hydrolase